MAKQLSDTNTKKEFVQKYMLDDYSRAIPTSALSTGSEKVVSFKFIYIYIYFMNLLYLSVNAFPRQTKVPAS